MIQMLELKRLKLRMFIIQNLCLCRVEFAVLKGVIIQIEKS